MRFRNANSVKELLLQLSPTDIYNNVGVDHPVLKDAALCGGKYSKVTVDDRNSSVTKKFMLGNIEETFVNLLLFLTIFVLR